MHRLPSKSAVRRIRLAALLLGAKCLIAPVAAGVMLYSLAVGDNELALVALTAALLAAPVVLLQWMVAHRASCPLCLAPVLANKGCSRHREARTLFGSYRLRVALAVIFLNRFRCPFCGEPTVLEVRQGRRR